MSDESKQDSVIKLRAHHILCFHAYSGRGYDETFIQNMNMLKTLFLVNPDTKIRIISHPDSVCDACPHLKNNRCFEDGTYEQEERIHDRDKTVMSCLEISEGEIMTVRNAFERAEAAITSEKLRQICHTCNWLPNSSCAEKITTEFWNQK